MKKTIFRIIICSVLLASSFILVLPAEIAQASSTEILRPNAAGDLTQFDCYPDGGEVNWQDVDEAGAGGDGDATYVEATSNEKKDLYNIAAHSEGSGIINHVKLYTLMKRINVSNKRGKIGIKSGDTEDWGDTVEVDTTYTEYTRQFDTDPNTEAAWTWEAVDALQVGVYVHTVSSNGLRCTQVYVEVDYTPAVAPTVTTQAASSVEETTATGNGNITDTGSENCTRRGFAYMVGTSGDPTTGDSVAYDDGDYGTGNFTKAITGLTSGESYRVRAYAVNTGGTGYGTTVQMSTKCNDPTSLAVASQLYNSISLTWTKGTGAEKTMIRYDTAGYPANVAAGTQGYYDTGSSTTVGSLSSGQIYYFRAWAWDTNAGYSDGYVSVTDYTLPADASALVATTYSDEQINLTWSNGTGGDKTHVRGKAGAYPDNIADGYQVYFDTGESASDVGLTPGGAYCYRAWAYDSTSGYYSDGYTQATATTYSQPSVTTNAATSVEETSGTLSANITATGGANASVRGFEWDTDTGTPYTNEWHESGSYGVANFTKALTELTEGELYYFRGYATNTYGTANGTEVLFLTKPDKPWDFNATTVNSTVISFVWTKGAGAQKTYIRGKDGSYPTDRADGYLVYNDTDNTTTDGGLLSGHTYYYKAWSYATEGGLEQYSDNYESDSAKSDRVLLMWIVWQYGETFNDLSDYDNDATPTFRTASSDADVVATISSQSSTAEQGQPPVATTGGWIMITEVPGTPGELFTEGGTDYPGGPEIAAFAEDMRTPYESLAYPLAFGSAMLVFIVLFGATHKAKMGVKGSLLLACIGAEVTLSFWVFGGGGVINGFVLIPFGIISVFMLMIRNPQSPVVG